MATYYFDANGATAGFWTLTGNWNPSTALWSTNSAGTSATSAVTFTNADVAQFGFDGTTGTAGTATITTGITNTVNQVVTANLTGLQTIAGPGTLNLAGTTPTINVGSAGGLTISAPITGTAGFTKSGAGTLTATASSTGLIGGTVRVQAGDLRAGNQSAQIASNTFPAIDLWQIDAGASRTVWHSGAGYTCKPLTGSGVFYVGHSSAATSSAANGIEFDISNFSGALVGVSTQNATKAFIRINNINLTGQSYIDFRNEGGTGATFTQDLTFPTTASVGVAANPIIVSYSSAVSPTGAPVWNTSITADQNAGSVLIGSITRESSNAVNTTVTMTLQGSSASANTVSGIIANGTYPIAISKAGTNKWILSGTNTYTGANTVSAGTLVANNNAALGAASGTASSITTGATLEIGSGITVNKASTAFTLNGNTAANGAIYAPSGNAGLTASGFTLGTATTDIKADAGATLTLTSAGAIGGNFTLRHIGAGTAVLAQTAASTFTALNIQSGTVSVSAALAAGGTASGIGNGSTAAANWLIGSTASAGTFRYTGAASSSNRNFTIGTAGSTFDASGSGVLTLTGTTPAFSAANTACTLTLAGMAGTSAAPNTSAMVLANNGTGAVALTKTGVGAWELSASQTYTGTTTVTGGSLAFSENNISTDVTFNGPGTLRKVVLNGVSKTITCAAGASDVAELIATSSHNTITGSTNITTGTLKLTTEAFAATKPVKVAGDTNVVVTSKLQTSTGILQRGQMRYGGNLTFQAGSTFIIGG